MAVADLQKAQPGGRGGQRGIHKPERTGHAAGNSPEHAGTSPGHAFEHPTAAGTGALPRFVVLVVVIEFAHRQSPWTLDWVRGRDRRGGGFIPNRSKTA